VTDLPPMVEKLLLDVVADGFTVYCCGPRSAPTALAASYHWENCVDHLVIRSCDRVAAARVPKLGRVDMFAPEVVVWAYEGPAECTMRALLNLVHPQHPMPRPMSTRRRAPCTYPGINSARCRSSCLRRLELERARSGWRGCEANPNHDHRGVPR
jgi:hypothetical protein